MYIRDKINTRRGLSFDHRVVDNWAPSLGTVKRATGKHTRHEETEDSALSLTCMPLCAATAVYSSFFFSFFFLFQGSSLRLSLKGHGVHLVSSFGGRACMIGNCIA